VCGGGFGDGLRRRRFQFDQRWRDRLAGRHVEVDAWREFYDATGRLLPGDMQRVAVRIKAAIEKLFGVKVLAVNTLNRKGKTKRFKGIKGKQQDVKRAIVKLAEGDKIDVTTRI